MRLVLDRAVAATAVLEFLAAVSMVGRTTSASDAFAASTAMIALAVVVAAAIGRIGGVPRGLVAMWLVLGALRVVIEFGGAPVEWTTTLSITAQGESSSVSEHANELEFGQGEAPAHLVK